MQNNIPRFTVSRISGYIKDLFDRDFNLRLLAVEGELSNVKYHERGHIYFTLKDERAAINGIMFAGNTRTLRTRLQSGMKVVVTGSISTYEKGGAYQIYAQKIEEAGIGDLHQRFEETKKRLEEEGLFSPMYKKPIPAYALKIGIVTAATGAAIQDIQNIARRRNPCVQLILCSALVQGQDAAPSIVRGIEKLDKMGLDVLIVGRGGGSLEDLWAFNEEIVARAIFNADTPVISAVGHETDFTIADFVSDLRAPTPSAAAELAVFDAEAYLKKVAQHEQMLKDRMERKKERLRLRLLNYSERMARYAPAARLNEMKLRLINGEERLRDRMKRQLENKKTGLAERETALRLGMTDRLEQKKHRLQLQAVRLEGASPLKRLSNGYVFAEDARGTALKDTSQLKVGDTVRLHLKKGGAVTEIKEIIYE